MDQQKISQTGGWLNALLPTSSLVELQTLSRKVTCPACHRTDRTIRNIARWSREDWTFYFVCTATFLFLPCLCFPPHGSSTTIHYCRHCGLRLAIYQEPKTHVFGRISEVGFGMPSTIKRKPPQPVESPFGLPGNVNIVEILMPPSEQHRHVSPTAVVDLAQVKTSCVPREKKTRQYIDNLIKVDGGRLKIRPYQADENLVLLPVPEYGDPVHVGVPSGGGAEMALLSSATPVGVVIGWMLYEESVTNWDISFSVRVPDDSSSGRLVPEREPKAFKTVSFKVAHSYGSNPHFEWLSSCGPLVWALREFTDPSNASDQPMDCWLLLDAYDRLVAVATTSILGGELRLYGTFGGRFLDEITVSLISCRHQLRRRLDWLWAEACKGV